MYVLGRFQCTPLPYVTFHHRDLLVQISIKMLTASFQYSVTFFSFNLFSSHQREKLPDHQQQCCTTILYNMPHNYHE